MKTIKHISGRLDAPEASANQPTVKWAPYALAGAAAVLMTACAGMSQQQSGQTGGLVGAGIGALTGGALAKSSGANRGQSAAAAVVGGLAGYGVGTKIGRENGMQGVDHTIVPNE